MRKIVVGMLGLVFLFLGHDQAFSLPQGLGLENSAITGASSYDMVYGEYVKAIRLKIGNNMSKTLKVLEEGKVGLDFELSSDGKLSWVHINKEKTNASQVMIDSAIKAVNDSSPFEPFPDALAKKGNKLPFNITLSLKPAPATGANQK